MCLVMKSVPNMFYCHLKINLSDNNSIYNLSNKYNIGTFIPLKKK